MEKLYDQVKCLIVRDSTLKNSSGFLPKLPGKGLQSKGKGNKVISREWRKGWQESSLSGTRFEALSSLVPMHLSFAFSLFAMFSLPSL